jgi:hypothetical protein
VLTSADLEMNVLEFRHRSFQFERLAEVGAEPFAVFSRTETESERQLRPKLVRLAVVVPQGWLVLDPAADLLRVSRDGRVPKVDDGEALEVAAEPSEFEEQGLGWRRQATRPSEFVYAPAELAGRLLGPDALGRLGLGDAPGPR